MKHARIIMAMLVLLGAASLAEAQIVVSSTTASTTHIKKEKPKSGREKGLIIRPEAGVGMGFISALAEINSTVTYQFSPYFAIGGGLGYDYEFYYRDCESRPSWVPIFANARAYFCDRKVSPFLDLKIGFNIPITKGKQGRWEEKTHGFSIGGTIGVQYKGFDFGITGRTLNVFEDDLNHDNCEVDGMISEYDKNKHLGSVTISVGYNIPVKKK